MALFSTDCQFGACGGLAAPGMVRRMSKASQLIAVIGAKGGAGASCLAAAIAHGYSTRGTSVVLVDLDTGGGGIETLLGIESEPGARWPEMDAALGEVDGAGLMAALPRWAGVAVLSAARQNPITLPDEVVLDICAGLLRNGETVVLDLPRPAAWTPAIRALLADANQIYLATPATITGVAGAVAVAGLVTEFSTRRRGPNCEIVLRTRRGNITHYAEVAELVGWPVACQYRDDRDLAAGVELGAGPLTRRSRLAKAGLQLVDLAA